MKVRQLQVNVYYGRDSLWYNDKIDRFLLPHELGDATSSAADIHCRSLNALVRRMRKMATAERCYH